MEFRTTASGSLDLRLQRPKRVVVEYQLGLPLVPSGFRFDPLKANPHPEVSFSGMDTPWHLSPELLSYFPRAKSPDSMVLDLGCGSGLHRAVCEHAGHQWVGLDYTNSNAPILGDGHALPFEDETFPFVLSMAVLEHIQHPGVLAREVFRVLQPGGIYLGTVAFLEPFHGDSFYHHTHLGAYNTLSVGGFSVERVAPNAQWSGLRAQASMGGLFPRMPAKLATASVLPLEIAHRLWWRIGRRLSGNASNASESARLLANSGSYYFVARKPY